MGVSTRVETNSGDWRQIDATFLVCSVVNMPCISRWVRLAPHVDLDGGAVDIVIIRDLPHHRVNLVRMLVDAANGQHLDPQSPVEVYKARRAVLFPEGGGPVTVSGDYHSPGPEAVTIDVHPRAARFIF